MEKKYLYKSSALALIFTALVSTWYFSQKSPEVLVATPASQMTNPAELKGIILLFNPTQTSLRTGQQQEFSLKLDTGIETINKLKVIVNYDPMYLKLASPVKPGVFYKDLKTEFTNGQIVLIGEGAVVGQGTLATLNFQAQNSGTTILEISSSSQLFKENTEKNLLQSILNAEVEIN